MDEEPAASSPSNRRFVARSRTTVALLVLGAAVLAFAAGRAVDSVGPLVVGLAAIVAIVAAWVAGTVAPSGADLLALSGREALRSELDRARRHRRGFALVRLELAGAGWDLPPTPSSDGIAAVTLRLIGSSLRITDRAWLEDGDVILLLPESDRSTAEAFVDRLRSSAPARFTERQGVASFPDDGITSGALLDALDRMMRGTPVPSPIAATRADRQIAAADLATAIENASVESEIG